MERWFTVEGKMILASVPRAQLEGMIDRMQVSDAQRRALLEQAPAGADAPVADAPGPSHVGHPARSGG